MSHDQPSAASPATDHNQQPLAEPVSAPADADTRIDTPAPPPPKKRRGCWAGGFVLLWRLLAAAVRHWRVTLILISLLVVGFAAWWLTMRLSDDRPLFSVEHSEAIAESPEEIRAMRDIGQWEFLSIDTEELIESHERGLFGDRHLVRVFRGTLRIGIDMQRATPDWFTPKGETAVVRLPDVVLLDSAFINESRTVTFYEEGNWNAAEKQKQLDRARQAMLKRALNAQNLQQARKQAESQFRYLFNTFGYKDVVFTFEPQNPLP